jgi:hypothetical protein
MISFKDYLVESLDKPYKYKWLTTSNRVWKGAFIPENTELGYEFIAKFLDEGEAWIEFYQYRKGDDFKVGRTEMTGTGDSFRVAATIGAMLIEFAKATNPKLIEFVAKYNEESRVSLYRKLSAMLKVKLGYDRVEEGPYYTRNGKDVRFTIYRDGTNGKS